MSDTNSFHIHESTLDPPQDADATAKAIDIRGEALLERLGVGGMGEVYRCGDEALQRDLAIKILKAELRGNANAEERFLREARLTGSLQHPGIVPIHNLSRFADGRPCYTMKLVRGRTFADMLRDEPQGPERLPRLLAILEKVCQAVAYAHSKHVIHRDLKPGNVMVGEFGEVQVMDWGLAKQLHVSEPAPPVEATEDVETAAWSQEGEGLSRAGSALGTPAYMPPEQAAGDWDIVDERADVFALGAILCEMLTGRPPYIDSNREELLRRARRGDMAEALSRLSKCGTDAVLLELCRECLAAERLQRPRHAGVVAERLASYQAEVRERLRQAELQRARAEIKALEERKRRRLIAALALAALLLLSGGVAAWWQWQQRRAKADGAVELALGQARLLLDDARSNVLNAAGYDKAVAAAHNAVEIASAGGASADMQGQAEKWFREVDEEAKAAAKDRRLLAALLEVRGPHEGPKYNRDENGMIMALAEPTAEEQFASAFRDWGLDVEAVPIKEARDRLKARPAAVVTEVIAALDEWANQLRVGKKQEAARRVAELAKALDDKPGSLRRELREILARGQLQIERELGALAAALRPVPLPVILPLGVDRQRLRQLSAKIDPATEPVLGLLTLTRALQNVGEEALMERLVRAALTARPQEVVLYHTLGLLLTVQGPSRREEAIAFYRAARCLRPDLGVTLALALLHSGRGDEGRALLAQMVRERHDSPYLNYQHGYVLDAQRKYVEAATAYRTAIELKPDYAEAYNDLGTTLYRQGKSIEAEMAWRKAIALKPDSSTSYSNLGVVLQAQGKNVEAEAAHRKAIALKPDNYSAYNNLGAFLNDAQGKHVEAEAGFRKVIALKPNSVMGYFNLGNALREQRKHADAAAAYLKTIALNPNYIEAYCSLGNALSDQGKPVEAEAICRKAIALNPDYASSYNALGVALNTQKKYVQAEAACREAIALNPRYAEAHGNLGIALSAQRKATEAEAAYRKVIALKPDDARAYYSLGSVWARQGKHVKAEAAFRKAIALKPDEARAYCGLGAVLYHQKKLAQAESAWRKAIELKPDFASAYGNLAASFYSQGKHSEAEAVCRKVIELKPNDPLAYIKLGTILNDQLWKHAEAEAAFRKAVTLKPDFAEGFNDLGYTLNLQEKSVEAEAVLRKAIALKPDYALAYGNLGVSLRGQGRFTESLAAFRRCHELGSKQSGWGSSSLQWLRDTERMAEVEKKLPAVLQGEATPANASEAIALAWICRQPYKKRYAASARLYADAFALDAKYAADIVEDHRYYAACRAAQAAARQGEDARLLPDKVVVMFRLWALRWLREHLSAYAKSIEKNKPDENKSIQRSLAYWRVDPALASVRDPQALKRLPDNERTAWRALWRDVNELAKRAADK